MNPCLVETYKIKKKGKRTNFTIWISFDLYRWKSVLQLIHVFIHSHYVQNPDWQCYLVQVSVESIFHGKRGLRSSLMCEEKEWWLMCSRRCWCLRNSVYEVKRHWLWLSLHIPCDSEKQGWQLAGAGQGARCRASRCKAAQNLKRLFLWRRNASQIAQLHWVI